MKPAFVKQFETLITEDDARLVVERFDPVDGNDGKPGILLIHGIGQNRYTWNMPGRSFAEHLARRGHTVFNLELRGHGWSRGDPPQYPTSLCQYVDYDVPAAIRHAVKETGGRIFIIAHSMGAIITCLLHRAMQDYLKGIISVAGPTHFGRGMFMVKWLARTGLALEGLLPGFIPRLPHFPVDWIGKLTRLFVFYLNLPHNHFPYQIWVPRSLEKEKLLFRIGDAFDRDGLPVFLEFLEMAAERKHPRESLARYRSRLTDLKVPILFIVGSQDKVVPLESVRPGYEMVPSPDKTLKLFDRECTDADWGHVDIICGREAPEKIWPYMVEWLEGRC